MPFPALIPAIGAALAKAAPAAAAVGSGVAKASPYLLSAATLLPFLGGRGGAATKAAAKQTVEQLKKGQLNNLANQLGITGSRGKGMAELREEVMDALVAQQMPSTTRLGVLQGTGTGSALGRSAVGGAAIMGGIDALTDGGGVGEVDLAGLMAGGGMSQQIGLMGQDLSRLRMATSVADAFNLRMSGVESELSSLLSPADLYSISTAAAADQMAQQGMGIAMQAGAGVPQL